MRIFGINTGEQRDYRAELEYMFTQLVPNAAAYQWVYGRSEETSVGVMKTTTYYGAYVIGFAAPNHLVILPFQNREDGIIPGDPIYADLNSIGKASYSKPLKRASLEIDGVKKTLNFIVIPGTTNKLANRFETGLGTAINVLQTEQAAAWTEFMKSLQEQVKANAGNRKAAIKAAKEREKEEKKEAKAAKKAGR